MQMTRLEEWLNRATRCLARTSAASVRREIAEHFESARDAALEGGATPEQAERRALEALGDPALANRGYRRAMLTSGEASLLRASTGKACAMASRPWLKVLCLSMPVLALAAAAWLAFMGRAELARVLLAAGLALGVVLAGPFLPIYSAGRSRIYRAFKWSTLAAAAWLALGAKPTLLFPCLWPLVWMETTRAQIRRKLPVGEWPKQLYL